MEFKRFTDVHEFAKIAEPVLKANEDVYSLFFGVLQGIKAGLYEDPLMAVVQSEGEPMALLQMTPPHPLNMIMLDEMQVDRTMDCIVAHLITSNLVIPSVISIKAWANGFAEKWGNETGMNWNIQMDQGLYRLDEVNNELQSSPGSWRYANENDCPLIEKWYLLFEKDTGLPTTAVDEVKKRVASFVDRREVFLWVDDGKVVSMMKKARPTQHGVTVSFVFTPEEERKKGYARTMVAAATKELLKEYDFCVLYTDLLNPTSNKIYQEIGYKRIADFVNIGFYE